MSRRMHGYLYLTLAMITVGSTVVASKIVAAGLPPFTATALRFAIALPLFLALMRMTRTSWPTLTPREWGLLLLQAGAGSVGYTTLLISGLRHASAADAGVIIGTLPVVSATIAIVILGERPRKAVVLAIALAAAGVLAIVFRNDAGDSHSLLGSLLIFGAVGCEGIFILLNKRIQTPIAPLALSTIMTAFGLAVAVIPAGFEMPWAHGFSDSAVIAVAYYALIPTVGGFLLWYAGAARVSGAEAALFTAVAPVSAVILAAVLLGEQIGQSQMIGIGCVLIANYPMVVNEWRARGLPRYILPDNAAEFHAHGLILAFNELGIEVLFPRSRGPEMKGAVERFFRTMADDLIHRLPGTTFSNTRERGD